MSTQKMLFADRFLETKETQAEARIKIEVLK